MEPNAAGASHGFVFRGPSGHAFEVHTAVPRDQPRDYLTAGIRPARLDHVSITVEDVPQTRDMFADILGMKLSDTADDGSFLFMRAADGFHHTVAVVKGEPGLHHYSFEARDISDLFRVCDQMRHFGRRLVWGPGHHGANAQSYFTYYRDGDGCIVEHSFGMTKIDNDSIYQPQVWPTNPSPDEEWLNLWGVPPSKMYGYPGIPTSSIWEATSVA
nr:VOC family protein [Allorhizobium ampelinum]